MYLCCNVISSIPSGATLVTALLPCHWQSSESPSESFPRPVTCARWLASSLSCFPWNSVPELQRPAAAAGRDRDGCDRYRHWAWPHWHVTWIAAASESWHIEWNDHLMACNNIWNAAAAYLGWRRSRHLRRPGDCSLSGRLSRLGSDGCCRCHPGPRPGPAGPADSRTHGPGLGPSHCELKFTAQPARQWLPRSWQRPTLWLEPRGFKLQWLGLTVTLHWPLRLLNSSSCNECNILCHECDCYSSGKILTATASAKANGCPSLREYDVSKKTLRPTSVIPPGYAV